MFYKLPQDTVFEAKARTRRATVVLFFLLIFIYVFFANLMAFSTILAFGIWLRHWGHIPVLEITLWTTLIAAVVAGFHFAVARAKTLDDMLEAIEAKSADPNDQFHQKFIRLVSEAESATGIHGIRPVVLNTPGSNAFSLQDGKGNCAIGVTDGLLSKLTDPELSGVVAHESAHLLHEDSRLIATAAYLFSVFGSIHSALGAVISGPGNSYSSRRGGSGGGGVLVILILWLVSGLGYLLAKLIGMAISREREYFADADGVAICKDPLSLAEALYKISHRYRGGCPPAFSAVFILDPEASGLAEQEGFLADLFSTHPPVSQRLNKLLSWAKSDLKTLQQIDENEEKQEGTRPEPASLVPAGQAVPTFMAYLNNQWVGPYNGLQLLALGTLAPGSWVCPAGTQDVQKASESPELLPLFQKQVQGSVSGQKCPRCRVPLVEETLEGTQAEKCPFCGGHLLKAGVLERLITRDPGAFNQEEVHKAKVWRDQQKGPLKNRDAFPQILCPYCQEPMGKGIHSSLTQVVLDHCNKPGCEAVWCDGGELETILMLLQDAKQAT
jgi:heat shock protein HtpX